MNFNPNTLKVIIACSLVLLIKGCKETTYEPKLFSDNNASDTFFDLQVGKVSLKVEVAALAEERTIGLMFRETLGEREGMLFIFEKGTQQSFWMKNTRIPLDIGYFSTNGTLLEIHKAKPYDRSGVPSKSHDIKFVLEVNSGGFKKLGIPIGSRIALDNISELIELRNLNPKDFNLPDSTH